MCGIVAYIGHREAYPVILKGLKRLEYRGYDSAGIAVLNSGLKVYKKKGRVTELEESVFGKDLDETIKKENDTNKLLNDAALKFCHLSWQI